MRQSFPSRTSISVQRHDRPSGPCHLIRRSFIQKRCCCRSSARCARHHARAGTARSCNAIARRGRLPRLRSNSALSCLRADHRTDFGAPARMSSRLPQRPRRSSSAPPISHSQSCAKPAAISALGRSVIAVAQDRVGATDARIRVTDFRQVPPFFATLVLFIASWPDLRRALIRRFLTVHARPKRCARASYEIEAQLGGYLMTVTLINVGVGTLTAWRARSAACPIRAGLGGGDIQRRPVARLLCCWRLGR